jgi:hypothetical protein
MCDACYVAEMCQVYCGYFKPSPEAQRAMTARAHCRDAAVFALEIQTRDTPRAILGIPNTAPMRGS